MANTNIGDAVAAIDPDIAGTNTDANPETSTADTLTYSIDAMSDTVFDIESSTGQLKTEAALDYETTDSYTATVTVSDGALSASINVTITVTDVDEDRPTVTITAASAVENNPQSGAFEVTITFSEVVNGFIASDITLTTTLTEGTGNATVTLTSGSDGDTEYTAEITPPDNAEGEVKIQVPAGAAQDAANLDNTASSEFGVDIDTKSPTVTITNVPSTTQNDGFEVTITFSEGVNLTGLGNITTADSVSRMYSLSGSGTTYTATFSRVDGKDGDVKIKVPAGFAKDSVDNENTESGEHTVSVDWRDPTVTVAVPSGTQTGAFNITITFSETVTGFVQGDISLSGTATATVTSFTGSGRTYTAEITPTTSGDVNINVDADVAEDTAENGNTAATQKTVQVLIETDPMDPVDPPIVEDGIDVLLAVFQEGVEIYDLSVTGPFELLISFRESMTGFEQSDLQVLRQGEVRDASNLITGWRCTIKEQGFMDCYATITPRVDGSLIFRVPAGAAHATEGGQPNVKVQLLVKVRLDTTITQPNQPPAFSSDSTTRSVSEDTASNQNIGSPL